MITKNVIWFTGLAISALCCLAAVPCHASDATDRGWKALLENNDAEAIAAFTEATQENSKDARAYLGLSYAYDLRVDDVNSWAAFAKALDAVDDPYPLIYAAQFTRKFSSNIDNPESGVLNLLNNIVDEPDATGVLQAMAYEMLAGIEQRAGRVSNARELYAKNGAIEHWRMIGPFHNISGCGHDFAYPPELTDDPKAVYEGSDGQKVWWFAPEHGRIDGWIDFARHFPTVSGVYYAQVYVYAESSQRCQLRLGTSGAYKLFLNNQLVSESVNEHNNDLDTYITNVTLANGWNRLLVKCDNSKLDRCNFLLRITDSSGKPLKLNTSINPQDFTKQDAQPEGVTNPFLAYFTDQLAKHPDHLENAFLLVEAHLRNDEVDSAEVVIKRVLKQSPNSIAAMMLALEAYQRTSRSDDVISTIEQITSLRPNLPLSLTYAYLRAISTEQLDSASQILEKIKTILPGTMDYYDAAISLAQSKSEMGKVVELQAEAFKTHPASISYATAAARMAARSERGYDAALEVVATHLQHNYSESGLLLKASLLEDGKRFEEWEKTYSQLFELSPAGPGYYSRKAESYASRKRWTDALTSIELAFKDAPTVTWMLYRAGVFKRTLKDTAGAIDYFQRALDCEPANFDAREALRELKGKPTPFSFMAQNNVDSLIRNAPGSSDYPEEDAVVLLNDVKRVVYDGSRCEMQYEYLVRVLTTQGIDRYKELYLPGGGSSSLIVEKAVVYKANGREIPADRDGGYAVFKSIEPGDFVYMRTRVQSSVRGALSGHFTDEFWVDDYVPVKLARYSLLMADNKNFTWTFLNGEANYTTTPTPQGELHVWSVVDAAPIEHEEDMPGYEIVARGLRLSSIPRWSEIVNWYYDIARTKTRTSLDVREKMDELFPPGSETTDSAIIAGVYKYITTDIRYSNVPFRQSGIVPQDARDVLVTRIGDCKDVATLCISMLAERNINAYHVLVSTNTSPLSRDPLPSVAFDHAIVMVELPGKNLFLDLTADNVPVGSVPFADQGAFALLIRRGESAPFRLSKEFFTPNNIIVNAEITLRSDLSASITQHYVHTGARTQFYRGAWKGAKKSDLERWLKEGLSSDFPDITLVDYSISNLDSLLPTVEYTLTYEVPNFTMEASDLLIVRLPWYAPFEPAPALSYAKREYPCEFVNYIDTITETLSINLPEGYQPHGAVDQSTFNNPVSNVTHTMKTRGNRMTFTRTATYRSSVVSTTDYESYKSYYNNVARSDRQSLLLVPIGTVIKPPSKSTRKLKQKS
ncbi:MAG: hypothetical protein J5I53_03140 [Bradyrhizobiaceae bacterium]|nr:hypothetical protein [Bradyrhizobiaceae bacterium]